MLRTVWAALVAIAVTIPLSTAVMLVAIVKSNARIIDPIIRAWAWCLVKAAGIELRVAGLEHDDPKQRYILIGNHHSYYDIPCVFAAMKSQPIRFMAKVSLFKIPIFGWSIGRAGFIPIDRKNRRTAVKSFELAVQRIRKGNTVVVFPEEGRSRERAMRPFQRGGFLLALRSELPILPIAIDGTYDVYRAGAKWITPGPVTIRIGTPIPTAGLTVRDKDRLLEASREQILGLLSGAQPDPAPAE